MRLVIIAVILICLSGCQEQQMKTWGQGAPPTDWQQFFGNGNIARLNYIQTQTLYKQGQAMADLAARVKKLELTFNPEDDKEEK